MVGSLGQELVGTDWSQVLQVRTAAAATTEPPGPTLFGSYSLEGRDLVFRPRLPFLPDTSYRATLDLPSFDRPLHFDFEVPTVPLEPPEVVAIHPASPTVPANLLRAYVEFSRPMRPDVIADYLHLVDEAGREVDLPFVEIDGGLWDPEGRRLTLIFHPGRLKRGVAPRELQGPPLESGKTYRLLIDAGWPSTTGEPISEAASRSWSVGAEDRQAVAPTAWKLDPPRIGTDDPLTIEFAEPLDHHLVARLITVLRAGEFVPGHVELSDMDTRWTFRPEAPWADEEYTLQVHPALEDLAGNNLRGLFDRGEGQAEEAVGVSELPFRPW